MRYSLAILFFFSVINLLGQNTRCYVYDEIDTPRERFFDFITTDINVFIEGDSGKVHGSVVHTFIPLRGNMDTVWLDGPGVKLKNAKLNGKRVQWKEKDKGILFTHDSIFNQDSVYTLEVEYTCYPKRGMYFIGWDDKTGRRRKQVWTQGQGIDNRHWFPHFDDMSEKVLISTSVTFDSTYKVLSNGRLDTVMTNLDGTKTWFYKMSKPHASYLTMIAIGDYTIDSVISQRGTPIYLWSYPDQVHKKKYTYFKTKEMVDYFENWFEFKYPWQTYSQVPVEDFLYGAMENTSATIFGDFFSVDSRQFQEKNYVYVNAHEFVHQWLGDLVTSRSSMSHWVHESMATYFHTRWYGEVFGKDVFDQMMRSYNDAAIAASTRNNYSISNAKAGSARFYLKGAFVVEMLKNYVGEENFRKAMNYFLRKHAYHNVDGNDLLNAFHESTGYSLRWFWDQWIYRGGEPNLQVEFSETDSTYNWNIRQVLGENNPITFKLPVNLEVNYKSGKKDVHFVMLSDTLTKLAYQKKGKIVTYPLFDPGSKIIKSIQFEKSSKYLKKQAFHSEYVLDRLDALEELKKYQIEKKRKLYHKIFFKANQYSAVKEEILNQLSGDKKSEKLFFEALKDKNYKVRQVALLHIVPDSKKKLGLIEKALEDSSYTNIEIALSKLMLSNSEKKRVYLLKVQNVVGDNTFNVRISWLTHNIELAENPDERKEYINQLVDFTSGSYNFVIRTKASEALKELQIFDPAFIGNLIDGCFSFNYKLRGVCYKILTFYAEKEEYKEIIADILTLKGLEEDKSNKIFKILKPKAKTE